MKKLLSFLLVMLLTFNIMGGVFAETPEGVETPVEEAEIVIEEEATQEEAETLLEEAACVDSVAAMYAYDIAVGFNYEDPESGVSGVIKHGCVGDPYTFDVTALNIEGYEILSIEGSLEGVFSETKTEVYVVLQKLDNEGEGAVSISVFDEDTGERLGGFGDGGPVGQEYDYRPIVDGYVKHEYPDEGYQFVRVEGSLTVTYTLDETPEIKVYYSKNPVAVTPDREVPITGTSSNLVMYSGLTLVSLLSLLFLISKKRVTE